VKISLAQLNPTIGDFDGNLEKIRQTLKSVKNENPDVVVFPELFLSGYPPLDLLERDDFINKYLESINDLLRISENYPGIGIICGVVQPNQNRFGKKLYNSALLVRGGKICFIQHKSLLPTYDVFDEARYFEPASSIDTYNYCGEILGITICEDIWNDPDIFPDRIYARDPLKMLNNKGATLFINISASPFGIGKELVRYRLLANHVRRYNRPFVMLNQVGANDELISDGRSLAMDGKANLIALLPSFEEKIVTIDLDNSISIGDFRPQEVVESVHNALILGINDYMKKCGFKKAVVGLSGGIDSAVVCSLAVEALGAENVLGVNMPSLYSSKSSIEDSKKLSKNLGIKLLAVPITPIFNSYIKTMRSHFSGRSEDETEENIQARIRGNILMALSNKFGYLTLSTGNKSELSVGYCTLYGDMSGGLSVLADVPKTLVYKLARYINRKKEIIPKSIIEKPPSAELKPDQKDQDTLPPYHVLDRILELYLDQGMSAEKIIESGLDQTTVKWVINAINKNEHKRRQAAPGLKITSKAFGIGRRMPVAAKYDW